MGGLNAPTKRSWFIVLALGVLSLILMLVLPTDSDWFYLSPITGILGIVLSLLAAKLPNL